MKFKTNHSIEQRTQRQETTNYMCLKHTISPLNKHKGLVEKRGEIIPRKDARSK